MSDYYRESAGPLFDLARQQRPADVARSCGKGSHVQGRAPTEDPRGPGGRAGRAERDRGADRAVDCGRVQAIERDASRRRD